MRLSIVIPAHNEEALIARAVGSAHEAARGAGIAEYEVIVADDTSDDRTGEIAKEQGARVVRIEARHIAAARNAGARVATGDVLLFIDADSVVTAGAVRGVMDRVGNGCGYGGGEIRWDGPCPMWSRVVLRGLQVVFRAVGLSAGAFVFATREVFEAVGGFDESVFAAEEVLFCWVARKYGRFGWVWGYVYTSGRKVRTHSAWEIAKIVLGVFPSPRKGFSDRSRLDLWYGERRVEPQAEDAHDSAE